MISIYSWTNTKNNKRYIGSTNNTFLRQNNHLDLLTKGSHHSWKFQADFDLFGKDTFIFETLETTTEDKQVQREQFYIDFYNTINNGYNIRPAQKRPTGNKPRTIVITYSTIASLLKTTEQNIRQKEHRGDFDFNNLESVILFLAANILLNNCKKLD